MSVNIPSLEMLRNGGGLEDINASEQTQREAAAGREQGLSDARKGTEKCNSFFRKKFSLYCGL